MKISSTLSLRNICLVLACLVLYGCSYQKRLIELEKRTYELQKQIKDLELEFNDVNNKFHILTEDINLIEESCEPSC